MPNEFQLIFNKTKKLLKANPSLYVLKSDKGNCTVLMDEHDYKEKIEDLLQDTVTYQKQKRHSLLMLQTKYNNLIKKTDY